MKVMTHSGTRRVSCVLACLLALAGCEAGSSGQHEREDPDPGDGGRDASSESDAGDAGRTADMCEQERAREEAFVQAHRACSAHSDCVALGDCSNAHFIAVSASSRTEGQALVDARECTAPDGPMFHAVCVQGACKVAYASGSCGEPEWTMCPDGMEWQVSGCGSATPFAGCFSTCDPLAPDPCAPGYSCRAVEVDPCGKDDGNTCAACAEPAHLCMPDPACEVGVHVKVDGRARGVMARDGAAQLSVSVSNQSDKTLTFTFDLPCHGPNVTGLGDYDLWDACLQGPCSEDVVPRTVTLAPHESQTLAETLLAPIPNTCNATPLAPGTYTLGLELSNVQGAIACPGTAAQLDVLEGNTQI